MPFYIKNIPIGLSVMFMGYMMKELRHRKRVVYIAFVVYVGLLLIYPSHLSIFEGETKSGNYITGELAFLSGCVMICGISKIMQKIKIANVFAYIGQHSMPYFCVHWIIIIMVGYIPYFGNEKPYIRLLMMILSCTLLLPLIDWLTKRKLLKWTIGE